jgi:hypothetical protein
LKDGLRARLSPLKGGRKFCLDDAKLVRAMGGLRLVLPRGSIPLWNSAVLTADFRWAMFQRREIGLERLLVRVFGDECKRWKTNKENQNMITNMRPRTARLLAITLGVVLAFAFSQTAFAEDNYYWINAKTGKPYPSSHLVPLGMKPSDVEADPNHFTIPGHGITLVRDSNGTWIDAKTGKPYPSSRLVPLGMKPSDVEADPNHFTIPGHGITLVRVPRPEEQTPEATHVGGSSPTGSTPPTHFVTPVPISMPCGH